MATKPKSAEVTPGPGHRAKRAVPRLSKELIDQFRLFETPDLSDLLNRLYAMTSEIHNLVNDRSIAGPACTVKLYPGDNLMLHKSLDIIEPGDIIVVDTTGCTTTAVIGDLVSQKAKHRGCEGIVIDGLVRDLPAMREVGLPVFAKGVTPVGPLHRGPGEVNYPIACGGVVVNPGDIVCGDATGVVVIPRAHAQTTLESAYAQRDKLRDYVDNIRRGNFSNDWVDDILAGNACAIED